VSTAIATDIILNSDLSCGTVLARAGRGGPRLEMGVPGLWDVGYIVFNSRS